MLSSVSATRMVASRQVFLRSVELENFRRVLRLLKDRLLLDKSQTKATCENLSTTLGLEKIPLLNGCFWQLVFIQPNVHWTVFAIGWKLRNVKTGKSDAQNLGILEWHRKPCQFWTNGKTQHENFPVVKAGIQNSPLPFSDLRTARPFNIERACTKHCEILRNYRNELIPHQKNWNLTWATSAMFARDCKTFFFSPCETTKN